ncbi:hypothetical protein HR12_16950 [Microbacterium sp. SUBG005]|nr:hypothetical protein HR12_16950 [Microbacterium sp. SUBG005]
MAGLVALAAPAASTAFTYVASIGADASEPAATGTATSGAEGADAGDLGDGYVDVGNGVSIPRNDPDGCDAPRWLHFGRMSASLNGDLIDRGPRALAAGPAGVDHGGVIRTYTVEPGDSLYAIGDRFCIANPLAIANLNHTRVIQPGDVLLLHPDAALPWIPYFSPPDAPGGYQQIPYQRAIEAMRVAAHSDDLDAMREIFRDDLAGLFPSVSDADVIALALDAGDLVALRQMFA